MIINYKINCNEYLINHNWGCSSIGRALKISFLEVRGLIPRISSQTFSKYLPNLLSTKTLTSLEKIMYPYITSLEKIMYPYVVQINLVGEDNVSLHGTNKLNFNRFVPVPILVLKG